MRGWSVPSGRCVSGDWVGKAVVVKSVAQLWEMRTRRAMTIESLVMPDDGTYAESIVGSAGNRKSPRTSTLRKRRRCLWRVWTAYRALRAASFCPGQTVLIPGIGSGVSTMALMFVVHLARG